MKSGFTMIETMVVICLAAVIGASLFSSFIMGLKVWKRTASPDFVHRKVILGLEKFSRDLRCAYDYPSLGFVGEKYVVGFSNVEKDNIWNVTYDFSTQDGCLHRTRTMAGSYNETAQEKIVCEIDEISFSYPIYKNETKTFDFQESWNYASSGLPTAVRVEAILKDGRVFKKFVTIPVAQ